MADLPCLACSPIEALSAEGRLFNLSLAMGQDGRAQRSLQVLQVEEGAPDTKDESNRPAKTLAEFTGALFAHGFGANLDEGSG